MSYSMYFTPTPSTNEVPTVLHTEPRPHIVSSTELVSIVRSRNMFAFSSDERAFNIESYFRTGTVRLPTSHPDFPHLLLLAPL